MNGGSLKKKRKRKRKKKNEEDEEVRFEEGTFYW